MYLYALAGAVSTFFCFCALYLARAQPIYSPKMLVSPSPIEAEKKATQNNTIPPTPQKPDYSKYCTASFATYVPIHEVTPDNIPTAIRKIIQKRKEQLQNPSSIIPFYISPRNNDHTQQNIAGYLIEYDNEIIIAYRGTKFAKDWSVNRKCKSIMHDFGNNTYAKVHRGFMKRYLDSEQDMRKKLHQLLANNPNKPLAITGHSQGGALAQLAALSLKSKPLANQKINHVITFGSARVFTQRSVSVYNQSLKDNTIHVTYKNDPIPSLAASRYYHTTGYKISKNNKPCKLEAHSYNAYTLFAREIDEKPENYTKKLSNNNDITPETIETLSNDIIYHNKNPNQEINAKFPPKSTHIFWYDPTYRPHLKKACTHAALAFIGGIKIDPPNATLPTTPNSSQKATLKHFGIYLRFLFRNQYQPVEILAIRRIALSEFSCEDKLTLIKKITAKKCKRDSQRLLQFSDNAADIYSLLNRIESPSELFSLYNHQTSQYLLLCETLNYRPADVKQTLKTIRQLSPLNLDQEKNTHFDRLDINKKLTDGAKMVIKVLEQEDLSLALKKVFLVELAYNKRSPLLNNLYLTNTQKLYEAIIEHKNEEGQDFFNKIAGSLGIKNLNNPLETIAMHLNTHCPKLVFFPSISLFGHPGNLTGPRPLCSRLQKRN